MQKVVPYILWPAVAFSCFVYIRRFYRRSNAPSDGPLPDAPPRQTTAGGAGSVPFVASRPAAGSSTATPDIEPSVAAALAAEGRSSTPARERAATEPDRSAASPPEEGSADPPGRTGLFAKDAPPPPKQRVLLKDLIEGIRLPCDLSPLVSLDDMHRGDIHAAFITKGNEPAEVGRRLGDELERLGFDLSSLSENQVLARRDDQELLVTLHANPELLEVDTHPMFPTAVAGDAVVEFDVR